MAQPWTRYYVNERSNYKQKKSVFKISFHPSQMTNLLMPTDLSLPEIRLMAFLDVLM